MVLQRYGIGFRGLDRTGKRGAVRCVPLRRNSGICRHVGNGHDGPFDIPHDAWLPGRPGRTDGVDERQVDSSSPSARPRGTPRTTSSKSTTARAAQISRARTGALMRRRPRNARARDYAPRRGAWRARFKHAAAVSTASLIGQCGLPMPGGQRFAERRAAIRRALSCALLPWRFLGMLRFVRCAGALLQMPL